MVFTSIIYRMKITLAFLSAFFFLNSTCSDDGGDEIGRTTQCDLYVEVNEFKYNSEETSGGTIDNVNINGDCLTVNYGASGCDGNTWQAMLIDAGVIMESFPPQRNVRFVLKNEEACLAYFQKATSFDITELQVEGMNEVVLHIKDYSSVNYQY